MAATLSVVGFNVFWILLDFDTGIEMVERPILYDRTRIMHAPIISGGFCESGMAGLMRRSLTLNMPCASVRAIRSCIMLCLGLLSRIITPAGTRTRLSGQTSPFERCLRIFWSERTRQSSVTWEREDWKTLDG